MARARPIDREPLPISACSHVPQAHVYNATCQPGTSFASETIVAVVRRSATPSRRSQPARCPPSAIWLISRMPYPEPFAGDFTDLDGAGPAVDGEYRACRIAGLRLCKLYYPPCDFLGTADPAVGYMCSNLIEKLCVFFRG